jgi:hypothetical protein
MGADVQRAAVIHAHPPVERVEDLLPVAAIADDIAHAQQAEVMTDGRLRQLERFAETRDVSLAVGEQHEKVQAGAVGQQAEERRQLFELFFTRPRNTFNHRSISLCVHTHHC